MTMTAKRHYIPHGIDMQGRDTESREVPEDLNCACGIVIWLAASLVLWFVVAMAVVAALQT